MKNSHPSHRGPNLGGWWLLWVCVALFVMTIWAASVWALT